MWFHLVFLFFEVCDDVDFFIGAPFCVYPRLIKLKSRTLWYFFCATDNGPEITKAIKGVLKDDYNYDSTVRPLFLPMETGCWFCGMDFYFSLPSMRCIGRSRSVCLLKMKVILCFIRINMALRLGKFRKLVKEWAGNCWIPEWRANWGNLRKFRRCSGNSIHLSSSYTCVSSFFLHTHAWNYLMEIVYSPKALAVLWEPCWKKCDP